MWYILVYILVSIAVSTYLVRDSGEEEDGLWGLLWPLLLVTGCIYVLTIAIPSWISKKIG